MSPDCTDECGRKLTPEIVRAADRWWGKGKHSAPIAVSCFCGGSLEDIQPVNTTHDYEETQDDQS